MTGSQNVIFKIFVQAFSTSAKQYAWSQWETSSRFGDEKRLLEIFGTSKTYRSPIIIQCG